MDIVDAQIIFIDARGFTNWAGKVDVFPYLKEFSSKFYAILQSAFDGYFFKNLGDGAMLVVENENTANPNFLKKLFKDTLLKISKVESDFSKLCKDLSVRHGSSIPLRLGWGVTKGWITKINEDYIGAEINKSARLCSIARPYGIILDREDFPELPKLPKNLDFQFFPQKRWLKGMTTAVDVWVTKDIAQQFLTRETIKHTPEVHIAGICLKKNGNAIEALIAKRKNSRKLFPNLYEGCGGQLAENETFATGVQRHYKLELNIDVQVVEDIHKFYYICERNEPVIPGIKFLCIYRDGEPYSENHEHVKWVREEELKALPEESFIQGLKSEFIDFIDRYKSMQ